MRGVAFSRAVADADVNFSVEALGISAATVGVCASLRDLRGESGWVAAVGPPLFWVFLARHFAPPFSGTGVQRQGSEERLWSPLRDRLCVLCRTSCGESSFLSREKRRRGRRWPCSLAFPLGMLMGGQDGLAQRAAARSRCPELCLSCASCVGTASSASACCHGRSAITSHAFCS